MKITVGLATVRASTVRAAIDSIINQSYSDWELIVVAQGNDSELKTALANSSEQDQRIRVVWTDRFGLSAARNLVVRQSASDIVAFTDDDCEAEADWLEVVASCFRADSRVGIVAGDLVATPRRSRFEMSTCPAAYLTEFTYIPQEHSYRGPDWMYWVGGNFAISRVAFDIVGPFDEALGAGTRFPACEDTDYALRAEALGIVTRLTPKSRVRHSFGRRYGLRNFIKHQRNYAVGRGAFSAKLTLWDHWLITGPWKQFGDLRIPKSKSDVVSLMFLRSYRHGFQEYIRDFELDEHYCSRDKSSLIPTRERVGEA